MNPFFFVEMKNINDYKICKAIVSLENEVDMLKNKIGSESPDGSIDLSNYVTNDGLTTKLENYYTMEEVDDKFVINDYEKDLSFTEGTIGTSSWRSVCYGNGMFVAVSWNSECAWSTDGKTFTEGTISADSWYSVCYGNEMFVAVSDGKCAWSTDGKTFTNGTVSTGTWRSVCYGNGMFVAVNSNGGKCAWSTDGKTFTDGTISTGALRGICYGNGMFVAVGSDAKCAWSTDGKTFTDGTISTGTWHSVCYGNEMFVAVSDDKCAWSEFGIVTAKSFVLKEETYTKTESDKLYTLKTELQQSMTITHIAPIDEECSINNFNIGTPVYMTGKVYVKDWKNEIWNKSTINDSIDCISSVKSIGTWKEYLGICTSKTDKENEVLSHNRGEITFATHGDYLVKVSDSSKFNIGDTIYIDFGENSSEIKILTEDISLNTKIQRTTIGIITSILDKTTVSVFKA